MVIALAIVLALADIEVTGDARAVDARALDDLVKLELGSAAASDRVSVRIDGGRADVTVTRGDKTRRGSVALAAGAAERTIALFAGELARRFETEPDPAPAPAASIEAAPPVPALPAAPTAPAVSAETPATNADGTTRSRTSGPYGILLAGGRYFFANRGTFVASPRLEGGLVSEPLRLGVSARYGFARASDPLGSATVHAITGGVAPSLRFGDALATGPRLELGALLASGDGTNAASASAFALSLGWEADTAIAIGRQAVVTLAIEAGWMMQGIDVRAADRTVLEIHGPFAGVSIGAGLLSERTP